MATHKQVKRKGFEWYRMLTKKQRKEYRQALFNRPETVFKNRYSNESYMRFKLNQVCGAYSFICGSFIPRETKQGDTYWFNIINKLTNNQ